MDRARADYRRPTKVWLNCTAYGNLSKTEKDDFSKGVGSKGMCNRTGKGINLWEKLQRENFQCEKKKTRNIHICQGFETKNRKCRIMRYLQQSGMVSAVCNGRGLSRAMQGRSSVRVATLLSAVWQGGDTFTSS